MTIGQSGEPGGDKDGHREDPRPVVLVVDDEPDLREALHELLSAATGAEVLTAESGQAALDIAQGRRIDLIVSDYRMPGMDGLEFLSRMSRSSPDVPRVMMTAYPDQDLAIRAINEASIETFLTKPLDPGEVVRVCHDLLGQRRVSEQRSLAFARAVGARVVPQILFAPELVSDPARAALLGMAMARPGIEAAMIIGRDGVAVSHRSESAFDVETASAMAAAAFAASDVASSSLGGGRVERLVIDMPAHHCVVMALGPNRLLLVLALTSVPQEALVEAADEMADALQPVLAQA